MEDERRHARRGGWGRSAGKRPKDATKPREKKEYIGDTERGGSKANPKTVAEGRRLKLDLGRIENRKGKTRQREIDEMQSGKAN